MNELVSSAALIDAGNSRIKWAMLGADGVLRAHGSVETAALRSNASALAPLFDAARGAPLSRVIVSNVAGEAVRRAIEHGLSEGGTSGFSVEWFRAATECAGVRNQYRDPGQLGADRFAALIGAHAIADASGADKLVVMAGTALTIDALTSEGDFLGGSIAPGTRLMRESLARGTAQLPMVNEAEAAGFARDTDSAIAQGTRDAVVGSVMQSLHRLAARAPSAIHLVASGGAMPALLPAIEAALAQSPRSSPVTITMRPQLVLEGLAAYAAAFAAPTVQR